MAIPLSKSSMTDKDTQRRGTCCASRHAALPLKQMLRVPKLSSLELSCYILVSSEAVISKPRVRKKNGEERGDFGNTVFLQSVFPPQFPATSATVL